MSSTPSVRRRNHVTNKRSPTKFAQGGFDFKLIRREGNVAMVIKKKQGYKYESLEVVILQPAIEKIVEGRTVCFEESLPPSTKWGQLGWTFVDYESADKKFASLVRKEQKRKLATSPQ